jgi:DNA-binding transcriptional ArsR family regulator/nitrogen regulatory protein PII
MTSKPLDELDPVWKALADPTRRRLLDLLDEAPRTTGELAKHFEQSRFAIMKHLAVLEGVGLIRVQREGRERWNHLDSAPLARIYDRWLSRQAAWTPTLEGEALHETPVGPLPPEESLPVEHDDGGGEPLKEIYMIVRPEERYPVERALQSVVPPIYHTMHAVGRGGHLEEGSRRRWSWRRREELTQFLPKTIVFVMVPESYVGPVLRAVGAALRLEGGPEDCGAGFAAVLPVGADHVIGATAAPPETRALAEGWAAAPRAEEPA